MRKRRLSIFVDESGILTEPDAASRQSLKVEFAQAVEPRKYRLFQVADLVCTLHLLELKLLNGIPLSQSERKFFRRGEKLSP